MNTIDVDALRRAASELGQVVIDPTQWPRLMEQISAGANSIGAALLGVTDRPTDVPRTPSVDDGFRYYFQNKMHLHGLRETRGTPMLAAGARVLIDQDLVTPDEMRSSAYYDALHSLDLGWFAGIALLSGAAPWLLAIQRTPRQGPFDPADKTILEWLSAPLTEAATLSKVVGSVALTSAGGALAAVRHAALSIGRGGVVLDANAAAQALFDAAIYVDGERRLRVSDPRARARIAAVVEALDGATDAVPVGIDPIVIERGEEPRVLSRFLSVPVAARSPFLGARALLVLSPLEARPGPSASVLGRVFGLTPAEAKVASLLAETASLEKVTEELRIGRETARTHLKAVFAKTGTRRQGELIALLTSLSTLLGSLAL